ncbi:hypothetical protein [Candidatus Pelagisphaera phototrophica]|uniref:hypothetical protein n=1 Tax=Candidatus Pelagisphaera phototrophica TaxID=2684113 RepID=UPI0019DAE82C|nr:hypothetical protein [Candidatus Pelagisphaera phototrophica]QXD32864.1 hypothetical protein GA004_03865 [Candidatus Pelagisphaera phototrophica]
MRKLRQHPDAEVVARSLEVLPKVEARSDIFALYQSALDFPGDRMKGRVAFGKACALCHQGLDGGGLVFGPLSLRLNRLGKRRFSEIFWTRTKRWLPNIKLFNFE